MSISKYGKPLTLIAIGIVLAIMSALMGGCASAPTIPATVTVTVEKYKPLPTWATETLPKPMPANDTVGERLKSNDARGGVIDYANCLRELLVRLDKGEAAGKEECTP